MSNIEYNQDKIHLPSKGLPYEKFEPALIDGEWVKVRRWKVGNQRDLNISSDMYTAYKKLLETCVVDPATFPFDKMLISDINAILYMIKIHSNGPKWKRRFMCDACGELQVGEVDLGEMETQDSDEIEDYKYTGIEVTLPDSKAKLVMHLPCLRDEKKVNAQIRNMRNSNRLGVESEDKKYVRMLQNVDSIDGKVMMEAEKFDWLMELSLHDEDAISNALSGKDSGLIPKVKCACAKCEYENELVLEITADFFRP